MKSPAAARLEYWAAVAIVASLQYTPIRLATRLGAFYTRLLDICVPRLRRAGRRNLQLALPQLTTTEQEATLDGVFRSLGRVLVALSRFPSIDACSISQWIRYEGFEHYEQAKALGNGVLFATAHLGNWELSAFAHALLSEPMNVVVRPLDNPLLDRLVTARREMSGNRVIGKRSFVRAILQALQRNEAVGILVDQNTALPDAIFVDFFGVPAAAGPGFAKLALHSGAVILPGFALWSESEARHVLRFYPPVPATGSIQTITQAVQARVEQAIREYPDQWLWIHRRWKTRPEGNPSLYY